MIEFEYDSGNSTIKILEIEMGLHEMPTIDPDLVTKCQKMCNPFIWKLDSERTDINFFLNKNQTIFYMPRYIQLEHENDVFLYTIPDDLLDYIETLVQLRNPHIKIMQLEEYNPRWSTVFFNFLLSKFEKRLHVLASLYKE